MLFSGPLSNQSACAMTWKQAQPYNKYKYIYNEHSVLNIGCVSRMGYHEWTIINMPSVFVWYFTYEIMQGFTCSLLYRTSVNNLLTYTKQ